MRLVLGQDQEVAGWVAAQLPHVEPSAFGPCVAFGVIDDAGSAVGGVVFHNYLPNYGTIEMSAASTSSRWLTRPIIRAIIGYAYDTARCRRITCITPRRNHTARRFLENFGFKREGLARRGFGTDDAVIFGLLDHEWRASRWMTGRSPRGKIQPKGASRA